MRRSLLLILTCLFVSITSFFYVNKSFSPHFVDEEDNFLLGKYLNNGEKLYSDLFSHHQPLGYVLSSGIQKISKPSSVYQLVKRHRMAVIAFSVVSSLLLVWYFGVTGFVFVLIYEPIKFFLFGHLFLSETFVVYPLVWITGVILFEQKTPSIPKYLLLGLSFSWIGLHLAPLWPLLLLLIVTLGVKHRSDYPHFIAVVLGGLPFILLCLPFISIPYYLHNVFVINFRYYIPNPEMNAQGIPLGLSLLTPLMAFGSSVKSNTMLLTQMISALFILASVFLFQKNRILVILCILVAGVTNARYTPPGSQFYSGFHLLPWIGVFLFLTLSLLKLSWQTTNEKMRMFILSGIGVVVLTSLIVSRNGLWQRVDVAKEYYVNYSQQIDVGDAISSMSDPGDTMFVAPDGWLMYWQTTTPHASKMLNYYGWMSQVPELQGYVSQMFERNTPMFFYYDSEPKAGIEPYLNNYRELKKFGEPSRLYVHTQKLERLTAQQKEKLKYYGYVFE